MLAAMESLAVKGRVPKSTLIPEMSDIIGDKHLLVVLVILSLYMQCPLTQIEMVNMLCGNTLRLFCTEGNSIN